jgi:hypothetical protein
MKIQIKILSVILIFSFLSLSCKEKEKAPGKWFKYGPPEIELTGVIVKEMVYGPPNFGEDPKTDLKVHIYVLKLPEAINVEGDKSDIYNADTYTGISEIQLDPGMKERVKLKNFVHKKVKVKGTLFGRLMGSHDYKKVLMNVFEVNSVNEKGSGAK